MIVCPRCSYENEDSAASCAGCGIDLPWALANLHRAAQPDLERGARPPEEAHARVRALRGLVVIVLLFAIPASAFLAFVSYLNWALSPSYARSGGDLVVAGFFLLVAVAGIPAAIIVLHRRRPRPNLLPALRILALIGLAGALLFGLMRLALLILPEHSGQSLVTQYKLGERDFRGISLERANLSGAVLHEANLSGAVLREADLAGVQLHASDLSGADLMGADMSGANVSEANLRQAVLRGVDLSGAQLYGANLSGADLRDADLTDANLFRTDLTGAAVTGEQLDRARSLRDTILPDGSVHQ